MSRYLAAIAFVTTAFALRLGLDPLLAERAPFLLFTLAVLAAAALGIGPGLVATAASVLLGTWAFLPPRYSLGPVAADEWANLGAFVVTSIAMLGFAHQLTAARRREVASKEAVAGSVRREQRLIDAVEDYAIYELDREGRILTWNRGAERLKGWRAEEIIGREYGILHPPERRASGEPRRELRIAEETGRFEEEAPRVRKDGSVFIADVKLFPLRDEAGHVYGFVKVTRDVTERKQAEAEIRRLNEQLGALVEERTRQLQEVIDELDAFTYTVSHDLRAPLRAMEGFSRILLEEHGEALEQDGRRYAHRIVHAAERMESLIDDLLAYSRLTRAQMDLRRTELAPMLARCVEEVRSATPAATDAQFDVEPELPTVIAEPTVLHQVLCNLISNAVKFQADGAAPQIRIRSERMKGKVRLWVEDNGIGILPEHQERIFRVFERLHGQELYPGTGVGLAIVRKGMERMGGDCGVESTLGKGSRFWIELGVGEKAQ